MLGSEHDARAEKLTAEHANRNGDLGIESVTPALGSRAGMHPAHAITGHRPRRRRDHERKRARPRESRPRSVLVVAAEP